MVSRSVAIYRFRRNRQIERKNQTTWVRLSNLTEMLKALTGLVIVVFFFGLLVVSFRMRQYGYIGVDIVKARYIGAGLLYLFSLSIPLFVCLVIEKGVSLEKELSRIQRIKLDLAAIVSLVIFGWMLSGLLHVSTGGVIPFLLWFVANYLLSGAILEEVRKPFPSIDQVWPLLYVLLSVWAFAVFVYPYIPSSFAGGKAENVRLMLGASVDTRGLPFQMEEEYTQNLRLLDTNVESYLLLIDYNGKDKLFELDKDLVKGVIYGVQEEPDGADSASVTPDQKLEKAEQKMEGK